MHHILNRSKVLLLVLVTMLPGCSNFGFSFVFEHLDFFARWKLGNMLDLSEQQKQQVSSAALEIRDWLREEDFPGLIEDLQTVRSLWDQGEGNLAIRSLRETLTRRQGQFMQFAWPLLQPLLLSLTAENAEAFEVFAKEQEGDWFEFTESEAAKDEWRIEKLEQWFGDLSDVQIEMVKQHTTLMPDEQSIRIQNSRQWRARLMQFALDDNVAELKRWSQDFSVWWTPEYKQLRNDNNAALDELLIVLLPTLTVSQREHASSEMQDWIERLGDVL